MPELTTNTLPQLYAKLDIHVRNIDWAMRLAVPCNEFNEEINKARYVVDEARKAMCIAQAIENKLRMKL